MREEDERFGEGKHGESRGKKRWRVGNSDRGERGGQGYFRRRRRR